MGFRVVRDQEQAQGRKGTNESHTFAGMSLVNSRLF